MQARRNLWVGLALVVVTLIVYWPATHFSFVAYDDSDYVYANDMVMQGLTWIGLKWVLTAIVSANWHPVTMLSHMLDCTLYGTYAGGHHLTNIIFQAINAVLLWLLLKRMTRAFWPSALVAALFAWHPLNVESVAWVAERKNLLSTFFLILTLWAYVSYTERPHLARYGLALGLFALGLMAKPMLVTLPCLLLLLDYWPLGRLLPATGATTTAGSPGFKSLPRLLWEKIPFIILAAAASVITLLVQSHWGAVKSFHQDPLAVRLLNAPVAGLGYLLKMVWPSGLCVLYPLPATPQIWAGIGSSLALLAITGLVFYFQGRHRWLLVGWLWYAITLGPVIGIIQVGAQASADRYTYVPLIGIFIMLAWGLDEGLRRQPSARRWAIPAVVVALLGCLLVTSTQLVYWRNSIALFSRAVQVTTNNINAYQGLGVAYSNAGDTAQSITAFHKAASIDPQDPQAQYLLGLELLDAGQFPEAEAALTRALASKTNNVILWNSLGVALAAQGKTAAAVTRFQGAIALNPDYPKPYLNYALVLEKMDQPGAAFTNFSRALQLNPAWPEAQEKMALFLATCPDSKWHRPAQALKLAQRANELTHHESIGDLETLARVYALNGDYSNAVNWTATARQIAVAGKLPSVVDRLDQALAGYRAGKVVPLPAGENPAREKPAEHLNPEP